MPWDKLSSLFGLAMTGGAYVQIVACEPIPGESLRFRIIYDCLVMARLSQKFRTQAVFDTRHGHQQNLDSFIQDVRDRAAELGYQVRAGDVHLLGGWFT
jgi:hypothetical protein